MHKKDKTLYLENFTRTISLIDSYVILEVFYKRMTQRFLLGWSNNMPADAVTSVLIRFSHQHVAHHHFVL